VITATRADLRAETVELTWTVSSLDLVIFQDCAGLAEGVRVYTEISVNGSNLMSGPCDAGAHRSSSLWSYQIGLEVCTSAHLTARLVRAEWQLPNGQTVQIDLPAGTIGLAIGEPVAFARPPVARCPADLDHSSR
jgi:hypothetical protein